MAFRRTAVAAMVLLAASCSSTAEPESALPAPTTETSTETTTATDSSAQTDPPNELDLIQLGEPDWDLLERRAVPALGGMTLGVSSDQVVHYDANALMVRSGFELDRGETIPSMVVALVGAREEGQPINTINQLTGSALGSVGTATPTGEGLEMFGLQMERWSFVAADPDGRKENLFSPYPRGTGGATKWDPFPLGELYLAETIAGVLAIGWTGTNEAELSEAKAIFDATAPTLELTTTDFAAIGNVASPVVAPTTLLDPPDRVEIPANWAPRLEGLTVQLDPGVYTSDAVATPMELTIGDNWWVQPNFPSWLVLTGSDSIGPGDRGLVFRTGVTEMMPVDNLYGAAGAGVDMSDLRAFAADPPPNLAVKLVEVEIDGLPAVQVDIDFIEPDSCGEGTVCEYLLYTKYVYQPDSIRVGVVNRAWQIEEGLAEPIYIFAQAQDPAWFDEVQPLIDSLRFAR